MKYSNTDRIKQTSIAKSTRRKIDVWFCLPAVLVFFFLFFGACNVHATTLSKTTNHIVNKIEMTNRIISGESGFTSQVNIGSNQTQDFFSAHGNAVINSDETGAWDNMQLTDSRVGQIGAVTLNTRIDMLSDFSFTWQVQMLKTASIIADGIGFVLHPTYTENEVKEMGNLNPIAQQIDSIGKAGGNLGTADLMNAFGFKLDSWYNGGYRRSIPGTFFGSTLHNVPDNYATADNIIDGKRVGALNNRSIWGPFGVFTKTDNTGYMTYTASDSDNGIQPDRIALNGNTGNTVNLVGLNWVNMTLRYSATDHRLWVIITDPSDANRKMTWSRELTTSEVTLISNRRYYALSILGSTGSYYAKQSIKKLGGSFTPETPTMVVRKAAANGNTLAPVQTTTGTVGQTYQTQAPIRMLPTSDNHYFSGVLSHVLLTSYDSDGNQVTQRIPPYMYTSNGVTWSYRIDPSLYAPLCFVTYVYRRTNNSSSGSANLDIPKPTLTFSDSSTNVGTTSSRTLVPNSTVFVTATLGNPSNGPTVWNRPKALIKLPSTLKGTNSTNVGVVGQLLNLQYGNIDQGTAQSITFPLKYIGQLPATLYSDSLPNSSGINLDLHGYLYDESPLNIAQQSSLNSTNGVRVDGSYFYVPTTLDAPYANQVVSESPDFSNSATKDIDSGNFVPQFGTPQKSASAVFHYWDVSKANGESITTMDPIKPGHPNTEIGNGSATTCTGLVGDPINGAPNPVEISGYQYLGYYEYTGTGSKSIWHNADDTPILYYQVPDGSVASQQVAYIYRPINGYISITPPNLDFGRHQIHASTDIGLNLSMIKNANLAFLDSRPHIGIPDSTGAWEIGVSSKQALTGTNSGATLTGASLTFDKARGNSSSVTSMNGTLTLGTDSEVTLVQSSSYGSANLIWLPTDIHLNVPAQNIAPDVYKTTLTWTVKNGL